MKHIRPSIRSLIPQKSAVDHRTPFDFMYLR